MGLAALRLELARAGLADVSAKVKVGLLHASALAPAEAEVRSMEAQAMRSRLNVEEIRTTARPPRDELNAPLVGARDYVIERLQLDLMIAQQRLTAAEEARTETARRARVGAGTDLERLDADVAVARATGALATLAERRKLRREFVERGTPGDQLTRRLHQTQLRHDAFIAQQALGAARQRLELIRAQRAVGAATELDQLRAEVELREREAELAHLARQLRTLELTRATTKPE